MSDDRIIQLIKSQCEEDVQTGMQLLVETYEEKIEGAVRFYSPGVDPHGQEDIRQDVLLKIRHSIRKKYRHEGKLWAYVKRVIRGVATDVYRRKNKIDQRMSIFATPGSDESGAPEPEAPFGDRPDERVIRAEQIRAVKSSLTQLRQQCRDIIDLHYREELKYREIAEKLNISIGTVASRLARCLDDLGGSLEIL